MGRKLHYKTFKTCLVQLKPTNKMIRFLSGLTCSENRIQPACHVVILFKKKGLKVKQKYVISSLDCVHAQCRPICPGGVRALCSRPAAPEDRALVPHNTWTF